METTIPFQGFYNSWHDQSLDWALESLCQNDSGDLYGTIHELAFNSIDWQSVHVAYAQEYVEQIAFIFELTTLKFESLSSPREYNFQTDRIFCDIDESEVIRMKETIDHSLLRKLCHEKFTNRSGFISHYKNDYTLWPIELSEWDHNQVGTLLEVYIMQHDNHNDKWELYLATEGLSEFSSNLICNSIKNEKVFRLLDYLRERNERKYTVKQCA